MKILKFLPYILLFLLVSGASAQDIKADLKRVNDAYRVTNLCMQVDMAYYETHSASDVLDSKNVKIARKGECYYSKLDEVELVQDEQRALMVDLENKMISVLPKGKFTHTMTLAPDIDSALKICSSYATINTKSGTRGYRFKFRSTELYAIDLIFNAKSYFLETLVVYYRGEEGKETLAPRVEMSYKRLKPDAVKLVPTSKYIYTKNDQPVATAQYNGFRILTNYAAYERAK